MAFLDFPSLISSMCKKWLFELSNFNTFGHLGFVWNGIWNMFKAQIRPEPYIKGYYDGQILTDIGRDLNDQMLPIAYAVVKGETKY